MKSFLNTATSYRHIPGHAMGIRRKINVQQSLGLAVQQEGLLVTMFGRKANVDFNRFKQCLQLLNCIMIRRRRVTMLLKKANVNKIFWRACLKSLNAAKLMVYSGTAHLNSFYSPPFPFKERDYALFHLINIIIVLLFSSLAYAS